MQCGSIHCLDTIYALNNIEAIGTMQCRSISTYGPNGIRIYSTGTLYASMSQAGAVTGTTLTISSPSTTAIPLVIQNTLLANKFTVGNDGRTTAQI